MTEPTRPLFGAFVGVIDPLGISPRDLWHRELSCGVICVIVPYV